MNAVSVNSALEELMSISGSKASREVAAKQHGVAAFAIAKEAYDFVVNYPVDWNTMTLSNELLDSIKLAVRSKFPFLTDEVIRKLGYHFAYLWK